MNVFDEKYEIRAAKIEDIDAIMQFIAKYWNPNHIFARNKQYFEYEFRDGNNIHFIVAIFRETGKIEGIYGYLYSSHTKGKMDAWGSILKANMGRGNLLLLGTELMKRFQSVVGCRYVCDVGTNPVTALPIADKILHFHPVKLNQFYLLNKYSKSFKLAFSKKVIYKPLPESFPFKVNVIKYEKIDDLIKDFNIEKLDCVPFKDNWYLSHRYFNHPWYNYEIYGLGTEGRNIEALLILRQVEHMSAVAIRIVDYIGNQRLFAGLENFFDKMLKDTKAEYVDFYECGFDESFIKEAGFLKREGNSVIIPNYFEPFKRENVEIYGFYSSHVATLFKGDGDQDRPNEDRGNW